MNKYYLVLLPDGDIEIRKTDVYMSSTEYDVVWHKSYNMGEKLEDNLMLMYKEWEKLENVENI